MDTNGYGGISPLYGRHYMVEVGQIRRTRRYHGGYDYLEVISLSDEFAQVFWLSKKKFDNYYVSSIIRGSEVVKWANTPLWRTLNDFS